jgi:hypothetical protein
MSTVLDVITEGLIVSNPQSSVETAAIKTGRTHLETIYPDVAFKVGIMPIEGNEGYAEVKFEGPEMYRRLFLLVVSERLNPNTHNQY